MRRVLSRLRWQLTLSHLVATAVTLVSMIAAVLFIGITTFVTQTSPARQPGIAARTVAQAIAPMVASGDESRLDPVLRDLADGSLRFGSSSGNGPPADRRPDFLDPSPPDIAYIVVLDPSGRPIASSDPTGAAFSPPERAEWASVAQRAAAIRRSGDEPVALRQAPGPAALGAASVTDEAGRPVGVVLVAQASLGSTEHGVNPLVLLGFFAAATLAVLAGASIFALISASLVAYLLSRRIVGRLERLGAAASALAAGDLSARVPVGAQDEVGLLGTRFNAMAADLQRTLAELQSERDRVAGLLEARRQLVAGVSHELRTPVATVRGYLESTLRRDGAVDAQVRKDLETIERELIRLQHLIDDLFTLSRAEVGRLDLRVAPVDIGGVARRLVETSAPLAWRQRQVQLLAEVAPDVPLACADLQRTEQIVANLLSNATRHTPPGGLVAAVVRAEADWVVLEIRDTGEGIEPDALPHVFERFYRGHDDDANGAGLGLALVKELTEAMGGSVAVTSSRMEGSTFTVRLPGAAADAAPGV